MTQPPLILASTSPYRRVLLERLGIPFRVVAPEVEEDALPGETPHALVLRLAQKKAGAVAQRFPQSLIIGSDQVAELDGEVIGKPGSHQEAVTQLTRASGRPLRYVNGLCLLRPDGTADTAVIPFTVHFRPLSPDRIERYLRRDQPYDCAGAIKSEQLGIALFSRMEGDDPTALMGLPLICLTAMLERAGVETV